MKKLLSLILSSLILLSLAACGQKDTTPSQDSTEDGKVYEMKLSTFVGSSDEQMKLMNDFVQKVDERTDGHVKITIYPGEQLGGYEQTFEETMRGTIEFGINSTAASFDNRLSASNLTGGVYKDYDTVEKVTAKGSTLYNTIDEAMDGLGLKFLGFFVGGYYNLCLNVEPEEGYADPDVQKNALIRVNTYEVTDKIISTMGYRTASLPGSEVYSSLQTGVIDGTTGQDFSLIINNYSDVLKYVIETRHLLSCDAIFMNKKLFDSMPQEYQDVIVECSQEFQQASIDYNRDFEEAAIPQLEAKGIEVIKLTDAEREKLDGRLRDEVWPWYVEQFGQEFMDGVKADAGIS